MSQSVYVMQSEIGLVKVGITSSLKNRLSQLRSASGLTIKVEATFECDRARAVEKAVHELLAAHRKHGEWFDVTPDQAREAVEAAIAHLANQPISVNLTMSGDELKTLRHAMRIKQDEFGQIIGVHSTTVSDWEREGKNKSVPRYAALIATLMADDPVLREKIIKMAGV